jgi:hypothetical protein
MATKNEQFFIDLGKGASWAAGVAFQRSNPLPLDKYSVFETEAKAIEYATTNAVAYPGQVVAYVDGDKMAVCVLAQNADGSALELQAIGGAIGDYETAAADTLPQKKAILGEDGETVVGYEVKWVPISAIVEGDGNTTYTFGKEEDKTLVITPYDEGVAGEASKVTFDFLTTAEVNALIEEAKKYADDNDANDNTTYAISYGEYEVEEGVTKKAIRLLGSDDSASYVDVADFLKDSVLEDVDYDADNNKLTFTWNTLDEDGNKVTTEVELTDMLSPYTAGNGIDITEQVISAKVKDGDKYIEVTANGIASKGIDEAIAAAIEAENLAQYTTEDEVKTIAYTKAEVYTKSETDSAITEAVRGATGGTDASSVLADLNAFKKAVKTEVWGSEVADDATTTTSSRIDDLVTELAGVKTTAEAAQTAGQVEAAIAAKGYEALIAEAKKAGTDAGAQASTNAANILALQSAVGEDGLTGRIATLEAYDAAHEPLFNALSGKVDGLETTVAGKADASTVETLSGTVGTISGKVDGHGTSIAALETAVADRYTKSEANSLLDAKADKSSVYTKDEIGALGGKTVIALIDEAKTAATYDDTAIKALIQGNTDAIAAEASRADTEEKRIVGLVEAEASRADTEEKRLAGLIGDNATAIAENAKNIAGNTAVINSILGNEDETDLNSIAELADWINKHGTEASEMATAIGNNEAAIKTINETTIPAAIETATGNAKTYTDNTIAALKLADTYEAKGTAATLLESYKVKDVDGTSLAVSEAGVASVKAVSTDLLTQGSDELVLFGGDAGQKVSE